MVVKLEKIDKGYNGPTVFADGTAIQGLTIVTQHLPNGINRTRYYNKLSTPGVEQLQT